MITRPFNSDDAETFYSWYHDERLSHFYRGFYTGASLEQCRNAPALMRGHILVGVTELRTDKAEELMGAVTLADKDRILRIYKLGLLVDPKVQNSGIGALLLQAGMKFAFNTMCAHKIVIETLVSDERVTRGALAAGFIQEGINRKTVFLDGIFYDEVSLGMLQSEYRQLGK